MRPVQLLLAFTNQFAYQNDVCCLHSALRSTSRWDLMACKTRSLVPCGTLRFWSCSLSWLQSASTLAVLPNLIVPWGHLLFPVHMHLPTLLEANTRAPGPHWILAHHKFQPDETPLVWMLTFSASELLFDLLWPGVGPLERGASVGTSSSIQVDCQIDCPLAACCMLHACHGCQIRNRTLCCLLPSL